MHRSLYPSKGALVKLEDEARGVIHDLRPKAEPNEAQLAMAGNRRVWVALSDLKPAYAPGQQVQHKPPRGRGLSLGTGVVLATRSLAGFEQVLVQFAETGETRWLDWRVLAQAMPVELRIARRQTGQHIDHAERFRLRMLSKALQIWNANTGAFGRLDIDPLPHQLDVARKVVTSPQARWLIADDVGLGKTIEVGLILHALSQRNRCRRVLIVCPSSLTKQWKDEMRAKFGRAFEIYQRDFRPEYADEMRLRENVVISLDLAKRDEHLARLIEAGFWDVIAFDEAHRLGRSETGEQTERYAHGQTRRVQVINLQSDDGFDNSAITLLLDRVSTIAQDMASVAGEMKDALAAEVLGELMSYIDMESILERATSMKMDQTEEEIAEAIREAQKARAAEDDILQFASAHQTRVSGGFDFRHMVSFVKGMAPIAGYEVRAEMHGGKTLEIELGEEDIGRWPEFGRRSIVRLTADHAKAIADPSLVPMDFEAGFVRDLSELANDRLIFDGLYAESQTEAEDHEDVVAVHQVRWQGLSGELLEEELIALSGNKDGAKELPHEEFAELLLRPMESVPASTPGNEDRSIAKAFAPAVESFVSRWAEADRMPSSVFLAASLKRRRQSPRT